MTRESYLLHVQRSRARVFGVELDRHLFGDPSWTMLLDLSWAKQQGRLVSVTSATMASGAPMTTGLRHLTRLAALGLIERISDDRDGRRSYVELSRRGVELMTGTLGRVSR